MGCDGNFFDSHSFEPCGELAAVDAVIVANEIFRRGIEREGLNDLLSSPGGRRIGRRVEMNDAPPIGRQDKEDVEQPERRREYNEKIDGRDVRQMILPKRPPRRRARPGRRVR